MLRQFSDWRISDLEKGFWKIFLQSLYEHNVVNCDTIAPLFNVFSKYPLHEYRMSSATQLSTNMYALRTNFYT